MSETPLLKEALTYAIRGWRIIPLYSMRDDGVCACGNCNCPNPGKHPRIRDWQKQATTNPKKVQQWFQKWPKSNIGLVTGPVSGIVVLDVDGSDGEASLGTWRPETLTARTGTGRHYYFQTLTAVRNSARRLGPGLDVRGEGGYVVAPPSRHASGAVYYWLEPEAPIQPPPAWLLNPKPIPNGTRNSTLHKIGSALRGKGATEAAIFEALMEENLRRCVPPLCEQEVRHIAASVGTYPVGHQGPTPLAEIGRQTISDFLGKPLPTKELLIDGVLYCRDRISLTGRRRHGKTTFLCNLALAGALGHSEYLGFSIPKPFSSVNSYLEDDPGELQAKLARMVNGAQMKARMHIYTREDFLRANISVDVRSQRFRDQVSSACNDARPGLVVFDNLGHLIGADYNNASRIHDLIQFVCEIGNDFNAAVLIAAHPRKGAQLNDRRQRGQKQTIRLADNPELFFEECMGSSHFINSTGSLWAIERDPATGRTRLLLGTQRLTGTHTLTIAEKDDFDWFHRVDDLAITKELLLNTPQRIQAWNLLPMTFSYKEAQGTVTPAMKSAGSFNPWWQELMRLGLVVRINDGKYQKGRC